jgi:hypothetical protein
MPVKHAFTSGKADGGDATLIRPSNWNADHIGGILFPSGMPEMWVAEAGGSDSNDGLSPGSAKATVAGAYSALPSVGGIVYPLPGRHDLGTGLVLTKGKRLQLQGVGHWLRHTSGGASQWEAGGGSVLYSSAGSPPANLISWAASNDNEEGFTAKDIAFECKTGITCAIYANGVNHGYIDNCNFWMKDTTSTALKLDHTTGNGDDASWWRIMRNITTVGAFLETLATGNHNQILVADNICFGDSGTAITIRGGHRCILRDNNVESTYIGPFYRLVNCYGCQTRGNSGESSTTGNIFMQIDGGSGNLLMDIGTSTPTASDKLYDFINAARDNLVVTGVITDQSSLYDGTSIADTDANKRNYWIGSGSASGVRDGSLWLPSIKRGAGSPAGVVFGYPGDLFLRSDGGAATCLYVKESGSNTTAGWVAK